MTTEGGRVEGGADENGVGFGRKAGQDQRALFSWAPAVARFWRCGVLRETARTDDDTRTRRANRAVAHASGYQ